MKNSANKKVPPRLEYLSFSKKKLFERSEDLFIRVYFEGDELPTTEKMDFGKMLAEALEDGMETSDDPMIAHALLLLPTYAKREHKVELTFGGVPFLARYDGYEPAQKGIGEVKSGTTKWSQSMVDKNEQMTMYAMLHYFKYECLPSWMRLHWFNTETGEVKTFETMRTKVEVLRYFNECKRTWEAIQTLIKNYERRN